MFFCKKDWKFRARSCSGAMTDGGASFEKEIDEEAAKECRWNELMERGVRVSLNFVKQLFSNLERKAV